MTNQGPAAAVTRAMSNSGRISASSMAGCYVCRVCSLDSRAPLHPVISSLSASCLLGQRAVGDPALSHTGSLPGIGSRIAYHAPGARTP